MRDLLPWGILGVPNPHGPLDHATWFPSPSQWREARGETPPKEIVYDTTDRIETIRTIPARQPVDPRGASDARHHHPRATDRHPRRRDLHHSCAAFVRHQWAVWQRHIDPAHHA